MIRKAQNKKQVINIDGPQGNAFFIIGQAINIMRQLRWSEEKQSEVFDLMKISDYKNLLVTFQDFFGNYVDFETSNEEYLSWFEVRV